jgi:seryl-tRNA synthetase
LEKIIELNRSRSELIQQLDTERAERKTISKDIHALLKQGKPEEAGLVKKQVAVISENAKKLKTELDRVEIERDQLFMALPNVMDERVPNGDDETDNEVLYEWWPEEVDDTIT